MEEALKIYINDSLDCTEFKQISEFLTDRFSNVHVPKLTEFAELRLNELNKLEKYFHKKS